MMLLDLTANEQTAFADVSKSRLSLQYIDILFIAPQTKIYRLLPHDYQLTSPNMNIWIIRINWEKWRELP